MALRGRSTGRPFLCPTKPDYYCLTHRKPPANQVPVIPTLVSKRGVEAVALDEETLRTKERELGPEHPDTLRSRFNLAIGYQELGRHREGVALHEENLRIYERVLGSEHPDTLEIRNVRALGYHDLGRHREGVALTEETLRIRERVLGPEHPDTLETRNVLARGYSELGRHQEAVKLDEQTLRIKERELGPEHPDTLDYRNVLARGYHDLGRDQEEMVVRAEQEPRRFFLERGATYYDGKANYLFECECVLTNERLIIEDVRGRVQQIPLRDITRVYPHTQLVPLLGTKSVDIGIRGPAAIHLHCKSNDEVRSIAMWIRRAMSSI
jgi:tetratricopeptide (TPR) repeat protein